MKVEPKEKQVTIDPNTWDLLLGDELTETAKNYLVHLVKGDPNLAHPVKELLRRNVFQATGEAVDYLLKEDTLIDLGIKRTEAGSCAAIVVRVGTCNDCYAEYKYPLSDIVDDLLTDFRESDDGNREHEKECIRRFSAEFRRFADQIDDAFGFDARKMVDEAQDPEAT